MKKSYYLLRFLLICLFGVLMGNHVYAKKQIEPLDNPMEHKLPLKVSVDKLFWTNNDLILTNKIEKYKHKQYLVQDYIKRSIEKNCVDSVAHLLGEIEVVCLWNSRITNDALGSTLYCVTYEFVFYVLDENGNVVYLYYSDKYSNDSHNSTEALMNHKEMIKNASVSIIGFIQEIANHHDQILNGLSHPRDVNYVPVSINAINVNDSDSKLLFFIEIDGEFKECISNKEIAKISLPVGLHTIKIYPNKYNSSSWGTKREYSYFNSIREAKSNYIFSYRQTIGKTICALLNENYLMFSYVSSFAPGLGDDGYSTLTVTTKDDFLSSVKINRIEDKHDSKKGGDKQSLLTDYDMHYTKNISTQPTTPSDVDVNISQAATKSRDTYVLIISNEQYEYLDKVNYAAHDGEIFKEYCTKTLGIPEKQIFYYTNATFGKITDGVEKLKYCLNNFEGSKAIVYYCGHGIPDEKTGQAYLIPVDGKGTNMTTCYSLKNLYKTLAATKAQSITYFMDACFTGANKEGSMLVAARGVAREPVKETLAGKTVVFSASSGDETAMTLEEQGHGLFTYYLLKKLQETEGNVTYGELADYINKNVKKDAFLINEKPQTPVVATSPAVQNTWKSMKLK